MNQESLTVVIERIIYANPQNGYMVLRTSCRGFPQGLVVVGYFGPVNLGEEIQIMGIWTNHPQFGSQFRAMEYKMVKPATIRGIEKYLGSGLIKGIGPVTAKRLVAAFGLETINIIEQDSERITTCPGVGEVRAKKIIEGWASQQAIHDVMIFLQGHGVSTAFAARIFKVFGNDAISKVSENPYILATEINGIGFKSADKIAAEFGITGADPRRLEAGLHYLLFMAFQEGHLFLTENELNEKASEILSVSDHAQNQNSLSKLVTEGKFIKKSHEGRELFYLPFAYRDESGSVQRIGALLQNPHPISRKRILDILPSATANLGITLSDQQQMAVEYSLKERFFILTGGPGTGKTTTLRAIVEAQKLSGRRVMLASPTGRAAKRLSEVTNREAKTIHRLLEFSPSDNKFKHDEKNPLKADTLIIDEASMLDMNLFYSILRAIPQSGNLILVGDVDQLPSVGAGLVLKQLIESKVAPVIRLNTIFRQARESLIITNAHRVNQGKMPILIKPDGHTNTDSYFLEAPEPENALELLKTVVSSSLPKRFGYHPIEDIQVLTPMRRASLGAQNLNQILQNSLNPPSPQKAELKHMHRIFREGDKVIQQRNNYDLEVFNGDIGFIRSINTEDQEISIEFGQGERLFQSTDLLDLDHAFAITVHKSQGSEYKAIVICLMTQHYMMLQRNLLYTAITRAKKSVLLIGTKKAIWLAVKNDKLKYRNTIFRELLIEKYSKTESKEVS